MNWLLKKASCLGYLFHSLSLGTSRGNNSNKRVTTSLLLAVRSNCGLKYCMFCVAGVTSENFVFFSDGNSPLELSEDTRGESFLKYSWARFVILCEWCMIERNIPTSRSQGQIYEASLYVLLTGRVNENRGTTWWWHYHRLVYMFDSFNLKQLLCNFKLFVKSLFDLKQFSGILFLYQFLEAIFQENPITSYSICSTIIKKCSNCWKLISRFSTHILE